MHLWRVSWHCPVENAEVYVWCATKDVALKIFDEHKARLPPGSHIDYESVEVPATSRQELVNWLNAHLPEKASRPIGKPRPDSVKR